MINMISARHPDGPAFNTRSRRVQQHSSNDSTPHTDAPAVPETGHTTPQSCLAENVDELLQMQVTDPFLQMYFKAPVKWKAYGKH